MAHRRGRRRRAVRVRRRKKNLEARARWEFGAPAAVANTKARIDAAKKRSGAVTKKATGPPQLLPENLLAWAVFRSCLSQLIVGPAGGVIGVSHASLDLKFRVFRVPSDREAEVWEKFELLEQVLVEEVNKSVAGTDA